jgi:hypothetical protein
MENERTTMHRFGIVLAALSLAVGPALAAEEGNDAEQKQKQKQ